MKKIIVAILLLFAIDSHAQTYSQESLIKDFLSGRLFILNEFAIADTDSSFFETMSNLEISSRKILEPSSGKELYGSLGERGVTVFEIEDTGKLNEEYVSIVDASVLKYFNTEDSLFYHIDGLPTHDPYNAINLLLNKVIDKVQKIGKNEAMAIWGREGQNGAIIVHCNRDEKLTGF